MIHTQLLDKVLKDTFERQTVIPPTTVNLDIWYKLCEDTQKRDLQLYKMQQALEKGIILVAHLTDLTMSRKRILDKEGV